MSHLWRSDPSGRKFRGPQDDDDNVFLRFVTLAERLVLHKIHARNQGRRKSDPQVTRLLRGGAADGELFRIEKRRPVLQQSEGAIVFVGGGDKQELFAVGRDIVVD